MRAYEKCRISRVSPWGWQNRQQFVQLSSPLSGASSRRQSAPRAGFLCWLLSASLGTDGTGLPVTNPVLILGLQQIGEFLGKGAALNTADLQAPH